MKFRQEVGEEKNGTFVDGAATWLVLSYYSGELPGKKGYRK